MKSVVTADFRELLRGLPGSVQRQARRAYALWRNDPYHPSLQFKRVSQRQPVFSARVGLDYRALAFWKGEAVTWFWIGTHAEYDSLLARL